MIRELLSSDVEFAQGMLNSSHSDAEILASLTLRGIEPAKAAELLDELRHGRKPSVLLAFLPGVEGSPQAGGPRPGGADAPPTPEPPHKHAHRGSHQRNGVSWWFIFLMVLFILALGYAYVEMGSDASKESVGKAKHELPPPPGK